MPESPMVPVRWTHDPAFLSWFDAAFAQLAAVFGLTQTGITTIPAWPALQVVLVGIAFQALLMVRRVFFVGDDLFTVTPPPPPPAPPGPTLADIAALLRQILARFPPPAPPPP